MRINKLALTGVALLSFAAMLSVAWSLTLAVAGDSVFYWFKDTFGDNWVEIVGIIGVIESAALGFSLLLTAVGFALSAAARRKARKRSEDVAT